MCKSSTFKSKSITSNRVAPWALPWTLPWASLVSYQIFAYVTSVFQVPRLGAEEDWDAAKASFFSFGTRGGVTG